MKPTDKILLISAAVGVVAAGVLYYFLPDLHWGWYLGVGLFVAAAVNQDSVKQVAAERLVNRDPESKR